MKKNLIKCLTGLAVVLVLAGCASRKAVVASDPISVQLKPAAGMEKMNISIVMEDKRPDLKNMRYSSRNFERPEFYFQNTINLVGYTFNYLNSVKIFKNISTKKASGNYTLKLSWISSHLNLNPWIPFVLRFQNRMTVDMSLIDPNGKVLWTYLLDGESVNTPSSFRVFRTHRCDLFQEKILDKLYPVAFNDMCTKLAAQPKK